MSSRHRQIVALPLSEGRFFDALDERDHAQVCVIAAAVRRDLFAFGPALGQHLKVNDLWCQVIGVVAAAASGAARGRLPLGRRAGRRGPSTRAAPPGRSSCR